MNKLGNSRIIKTFCFLCWNECGIRVHVKDGEVVRVDGDAEDPSTKDRSCPRSIVAIDLHRHSNRLNYPSKSVGKRGEGKWERISWQQGLDEIAEKIRKIRDMHGPEAVAVIAGRTTGCNVWPSRRWCNLFVQHVQQHQQQRQGDKPEI